MAKWNWDKVLGLPTEEDLNRLRPPEPPAEPVQSSLRTEPTALDRVADETTILRRIAVSNAIMPVLGPAAFLLGLWIWFRL